MSAEENVWRRSGGDWGIGHAQERTEARGIRQSAELHTWRFTLGAMSTAVKQYNVGLEDQLGGHSPGLRCCTSLDVGKERVNARRAKLTGRAVPTLTCGGNTSNGS